MTVRAPRSPPDTGSPDGVLTSPVVGRAVSGRVGLRPIVGGEFRKINGEPRRGSPASGGIVSVGRVASVRVGSFTAGNATSRRVRNGEVRSAFPGCVGWAVL